MAFADLKKPEYTCRFLPHPVPKRGSFLESYHELPEAVGGTLQFPTVPLSPEASSRGGQLGMHVLRDWKFYTGAGETALRSHRLSHRNGILGGNLEAVL